MVIYKKCGEICCKSCLRRWECGIKSYRYRK
nr:MAG TPA: Pheromone En-6, SIGNALING PROTEIN [Caudoviricetes sp.]